MAGYTLIEKVISFASLLSGIIMVNYYFILFSNKVRLIWFGVISELIFWCLWVGFEGLIFQIKKSNIPPTKFRLIQLCIIYHLLIFLNIKPQNNDNNDNYDMLLVFIGSFIKIIGHLLSIYSRQYLGLAFKGRIQIDKDIHNLITNGPFKYVRHPIYCGHFTYCFGAVMSTYFYWIPVFSLFLLISCIIYKIETEDVLLSNIYGKKFDKFKQNTPAKLIPYIY